MNFHELFSREWPIPCLWLVMKVARCLAPKLDLTNSGSTRFSVTVSIILKAAIARVMDDGTGGMRQGECGWRGREGPEGVGADSLRIFLLALSALDALVRAV